MNKDLYEAIQNQTPLQRLITAVFYPVLNAMAMYFAVAFFAIALNELDFQDGKE